MNLWSNMRSRFWSHANTDGFTVGKQVLFGETRRELHGDALFVVMKLNGRNKKERNELERKQFSMPRVRVPFDE